MNKNKLHDVMVIGLTLVSCAIVASLVVYHLQTVNAAYKHGFLQGATDVKAILAK